MVRKQGAGTRPAQAAGGTETAASYKPKSIVLFSDGTGNSSGKLFKTNVWRLYEALDLGPPTEERPHVQIAYYDNGVGTSQFRPLALLGGILGIGLKRNLLTIYRFLCRNYRPGDRIYAFGFSRGAFTIRLLVSVIAQEGVVEYRNERQLAYHARDAYREFCRQVWPNRWPARVAASLLRRLRDGLLRVKRAAFGEILYRDIAKQPTNIEFLGVWDTVAAYGGPSIEITRGIDDWIWPLTLPNYELSPKVLKARHALAIDDQRDAFQPLLWDEVREADVVRIGREVIVGLDGDGKPLRETVKAKPGRLEQVWFTGMHADVGGGYPDETLSYVSLQWMMGETDLCFLTQHEERIQGMANAYGPIHDSRAGLASYYRFQPRNIAAVLEPGARGAAPARVYRSQRDPELAREGYRDHGLLTEVKIHKSVVTRIQSGTDGYAPINLPPRFKIYPTDPAEHPKEGSGVEDLGFHERPGTARDWAGVWNLVWCRRIVYFLTLLASALLFTLPWWGKDADPLNLCDDARCWGRSAVGLLDYVLPDFARFWTAGFSENLDWTLVLAALILILMGTGRWLEKKMADRARALLKPRPAGRRSTFLARLMRVVGPPAAGMLHRVRESGPYQYAFFGFKWYALPAAAAAVTLSVIAILLLSLLGQTHLYFAERTAGLSRDGFCLQRPAGAAAGGAMREREFRPRPTCTPLGLKVVKGGEYVIAIRELQRFQDADYPIAPDGKRDPAKPLPGWIDLFKPMRRVVMVDWFQPLVAIRPPKGAGSAIYVDKLSPAASNPSRPDIYFAPFKAARDGNLYIFVNDAVLPGALETFYDNNKTGLACVSLAPAGTPTGQFPAPGSPCGKVSPSEAAAPTLGKKAAPGAAAPK
ncbi:MAG: DUF2235 domain-containing protein [Allosphingosinicella sp.]